MATFFVLSLFFRGGGEAGLRGNLKKTAATCSGLFFLKTKHPGWGPGFLVAARVGMGSAARSTDENLTAGVWLCSFKGTHFGERIFGETKGTDHLRGPSKAKTCFLYVSRGSLS